LGSLKEVSQEEASIKSSVARYFRYKVVNLMQILGRKDAYFELLGANKPIKTFLQGFSQ
jgi:hypothetical protein